MNTPKYTAKPFQEMTEDQYYDCLEVLPPLRWTKGPIEFFFVSEPYSGDLYKCCVRNHKTGRFYTALRSIHAPDQAIYDEILLIQV